MMKKPLWLFLILMLWIGFPIFSQSDYKASSVATKIDETEIDETRGPYQGTLLIIGGSASEIFDQKFMELVGGPDAPIVVIPTAISSDELTKDDLERFRKGYIDKGFINVTVLHTRDREEADSKAFVKPIKNAAGVWFSGGRQWRHADSYLGTKAHQAFFDLLERGGVIAGSSAGATIQGSYLARGDTKVNTIMMGDHEEGLGFMTNVAIDQHLFARNRQFDLFEILDNRPELLGIGLDENTGIIVSGDAFTVFGESYVAMYDGTRWSAERDTIYKLPKGSREFYLLKEGDRYDLKDRKVITE
ncbi:MAG: cyanophycinase [Bacteroidales bacterium]|nr:cyanophycinase [Bacteroidales bacterium]